MMGVKKQFRVPDEIKAQVLAAYGTGLTTDAVASQFKIGRSTVTMIVARAGAQRRVHGASAQKVPDIIHKPADNDNRAETPRHPILATGGKYALLDEYAAQNGMTTQRALQLWHKARAG